VVAITTFVLETHHTCRVLKNESDPVLPGMSFRQYRVRTKKSPILVTVENITMILLTVELLARLVFCPDRKRFFKKMLNWFDILSLVPFFISRVVTAIDPELEFNDTMKTIDTFRLIRVFRIFKVIKHLEGLKILFHTLKASAKELFLMVMLIVMMVLLFATLIYFAEQVDEDTGNHFVSIPIGFWWAAVTMTTLGYGDKVPKTAAGYLVGFVCAICGVLFIALPIPIIVNNFSMYYTHAKAQAKLPKKRKHALVGAADALKQQLSDFMTEPATEMTLTSRSPTPTVPADDVDRKRSDESAANSEDSGINVASVKSDKTVGGISVTFTDVDETYTSSEPKNGFKNGTVSCKIYVDSPEHTYTHPGETEVEPMKQRPTARRASIIPGGISNGSTPGNLKHTRPSFLHTDIYLYKGLR